MRKSTLMPCGDIGARGLSLKFSDERSMSGQNIAAYFSDIWQMIEDFFYSNKMDLFVEQLLDFFNSLPWEWILAAGVCVLITMAVYGFLRTMFFSAHSTKTNSVGWNGWNRNKAATKEIILTDIQGKFVVNIDEDDVPVLFRQVSSTNIFDFSISLVVANQSAYEIKVEKIIWEIWVGPFVKSGISKDSFWLNPKETGVRFHIKEVLNDVETQNLLKTSPALYPSAYFECTIIGDTHYGKFQKKFPQFDMKWKMSGYAQNMRIGILGSQLHVDGLTGLFDRRVLEDNLQAIVDSVADGYPCSFIMIDVDDFKKINDEHGHLVGDEVLKMVCSKVRDVIGGSGLGIRYGGDEISIILEGMRIDDAAKMAHEIKKMVTQHPFYVPEGVIHISLSIGVACLYQRTDYHNLIKKADDMLRMAKKRGKNQVCIDYGTNL